MASATTNPWGKSHSLLNLAIASLMLGNPDAKEINVAKSFKDVITSKSSLSQVVLQIMHSIVKGMHVILLSDDEIEKFAQPFPLFLVINFLIVALARIIFGNFFGLQNFMDLIHWD